MMTLWITLVALNTACFAVNIINKHYWILPINIIAIIICATNIKG